MSKQPQAAAQLKGTPLWRMSKKFNFAAEKIIPDSFVFCIILTFLVFVLSLLLCGKSPLELLVGWWDGLSSQFTLAFQMGIMVVVCATCARSPQVNRLLNKMSSMVHSRTTALVLMMIFGYVTSMMNYAFCTIVTPILAMQLAKHVRGLHFPMMVAGGYTCMILGQCLGPSATLYSNLATEGSSYAQIVGQTMSVAETCYNPMNIILFTVLAIAFTVIVVFTRPGEDELVELRDVATQADVEPKSYKSNQKAETPAEKMNTFRPIMWLVGAFIFAYAVYSFVTKGFLGSLNMNFVIFLFVGVNCFLFPEPHQWMEAPHRLHASGHGYHPPVPLLWRYHGHDVSGRRLGFCAGQCYHVCRHRSHHADLYLPVGLPGKSVYPLSGRTVYRAGTADCGGCKGHTRYRPGQLPQCVCAGR